MYVLCTYVGVRRGTECAESGGGGSHCIFRGQHKAAAEGHRGRSALVASIASCCFITAFVSYCELQVGCPAR